MLAVRWNMMLTRSVDSVLPHYLRQSPQLPTTIRQSFSWSSDVLTLACFRNAWDYCILKKDYFFLKCVLICYMIPKGWKLWRKNTAEKRSCEIALRSKARNSGCPKLPRFEWRIELITHFWSLNWICRFPRSKLAPLTFVDIPRSCSKCSLNRDSFLLLIAVVLSIQGSLAVRDDATVTVLARTLSFVLDAVDAVRTQLERVTVPSFDAAGHAQQKESSSVDSSTPHPSRQRLESSSTDGRDSVDQTPVVADRVKAERSGDAGRIEDSVSSSVVTPEVQVVSGNGVLINKEQEVVELLESTVHCSASPSPQFRSEQAPFSKERTGSAVGEESPVKIKKRDVVVDTVLITPGSQTQSGGHEQSISESPKRSENILSDSTEFCDERRSTATEGACEGRVSTSSVFATKGKRVASS